MADSRAKRTRSQTTLDSFVVNIGESPLKLAARSNKRPSTSNEPAPSHPPRPTTPPPTQTTPPLKRPFSPPKDGAIQADRDLKRPRHEGIFPLNKLSARPPSHSATSPYRRAQSVPPPTSDAIPLIDLNNIPPSPRRSPMKFRIASLPPEPQTDPASPRPPSPLESPTYSFEQPPSSLPITSDAPNPPDSPMSALTSLASDADMSDLSDREDNEPTPQPTPQPALQLSKPKLLPPSARVAALIPPAPPKPSTNRPPGSAVPTNQPHNAGTNGTLPKRGVTARMKAKQQAAPPKKPRHPSDKKPTLGAHVIKPNKFGRTPRENEPNIFEALRECSFFKSDLRRRCILAE